MNAQSSQSEFLVDIFVEGEDRRRFDWTPWLGSADDTDDLIARLAFNKLIRDRGGLLPKETFTASVFVVPPNARYRSGRPTECMKFVLTASR